MLCKILDAVRYRIKMTSHLTGKRVDVYECSRYLVLCIAEAAISRLFDEPRPELAVDFDNIAYFPSLDLSDQFWITGYDDRVIAFHVPAPVADLTFTPCNGDVGHGVDIVAAVLYDQRGLDDSAEHKGKACLV